MHALVRICFLCFIKPDAFNNKIQGHFFFHLLDVVAHMKNSEEIEIELKTTAVKLFSCVYKGNQMIYFIRRKKEKAKCESFRCWLLSQSVTLPYAKRHFKIKKCKSLLDSNSRHHLNQFFCSCVQSP